MLQQKEYLRLVYILFGFNFTFSVILFVSNILRYQSPPSDIQQNIPHYVQKLNQPYQNGFGCPGVWVKFFSLLLIQFFTALTYGKYISLNSQKSKLLSNTYFAISLGFLILYTIIYFILLAKGVFSTKTAKQKLERKLGKSFWKKKGFLGFTLLLTIHIINTSIFLAYIKKQEKE